MLGLKLIIFVQVLIAPCLAESYFGYFYREDREYDPEKIQSKIEGQFVDGIEIEAETYQFGPSHKDENFTCKDHDQQCTVDSECCAIDNMFCWYWNETGSIQNPPPYPLCKCHPMFQWDEKNWRCYPISFAQQMMMAAFMAFSCAILVALVAFCIHSCKYCWTYRNRIRHVSEIRRDRRFRRRQMRMPRVQARSIDEFVEIHNDTPVKLPTYEEIDSDRVIFTTVAPMASLPAMSGTLRSLPPAYESIVAGELVVTNDMPIEGVTVVTSIVPLQNSTERRDSQPQQQQTASCSQDGVTNGAFVTENHI